MGSEMASLQDGDKQNPPHLQMSSTDEQYGGPQQAGHSPKAQKMPVFTPNNAVERRPDHQQPDYSVSDRNRGNTREPDQPYSQFNGQPASNPQYESTAQPSDGRYKSNFGNTNGTDPRSTPKVEPPPQISNQYQSTFHQGFQINQQPEKNDSIINPTPGPQQSNPHDQRQISQVTTPKQEIPPNPEKSHFSEKQKSGLPASAAINHNPEQPHPPVQQSSFSQKPDPKKVDSSLARNQPVDDQRTQDPEKPASQINAGGNQSPGSPAANKPEPQPNPTEDETEPEKVYEIVDTLPDLPEELKQIKLSAEWKVDFKKYVESIPDYEETASRPEKGYFRLKTGSLYKGQFKGIYKHGVGVMRLPDNSEYAGFFKVDKFNTYGRLISSDGSVYVGEWRDNKKSGQGKMLIKGSGIYEGEFLNDKRDGNGKFNWIDNSSYQGEFSDECMQGKGVYTFPDGKTYDGQFFENKFDGIGVLKKGNKEIYRGNYKQDKKHGLGTYTDEEGVKYTGNWVEGCPKGKFTVELPDGTMFEENHA